MSAIAFGLILAFAVLVAAVGRAWWRAIEARRRAEERAAKAEQRATDAREVADVAKEAARYHSADADRFAAELQNHLHVCLGVLVHQDSGVMDR